MELTDAVRARHMCRNFSPDPVAPAQVDRLLDLARRAPSAGNSQGTSFVVLEGPAQTARYWDLTLPEARRDGFRWPGLLQAPVLVVVLASPRAYVRRYAEADKARSGLGDAVEAWPVPYWDVDAGMAVQTLLLAAVDAGLGACFFGLFQHEPAVLAMLGVPDGEHAVGTVALGHPLPDEPGRSAARARRPLRDVIHRGGW